MRPEQRLERAEHILVMMAVAGRRARQEWREQAREQNEKINILIHTQMETSEQINRMSRKVEETSEQVSQTSEQMAELTEAQKLTDQALRAFINSLRKGGNGNSS